MGMVVRLQHLGTQVSAATYSRCFLTSGIVYPEDGDDTLLRNVG
jgi:hypothetical protein